MFAAGGSQGQPVSILKHVRLSRTKRTNWAGLIMSVDRERPEVSGTPSGRRD
jgi:hypothetical protein